LSLVLLAACGPSNAQPSSKELNLYAFSEYIPQSLIDGFEKESGVTVTYDSYDTNEEMIAGLKNAPGKYDLVVPSDYAVEELIQTQGLLPLDLKTVPNAKYIKEDFAHPYFDPAGDPGQKYSLPYLWGTTGISYNQTKISTPITSWQDLWRPELAGHLVVLDDAREMMGIALLALGYDKNELNPGRLAEARDKLEELAPGIVAYDAEAPENYLLSDEAWVAVLYNGNAALAERQDPDLVYSLPQEGAGFWIDNMAIPSNASHPDAALAFMNFILKPENGAVLIHEYPYSTPNAGTLDYIKANDVDFYYSYINSLASNPSEDALQKSKLVRYIDPAIAGLYEEYWAQVKSTK